MTDKAKIFDEIVQDRRSCRIFEQDTPFDSSIVSRSIERAALSANSSNLQLWEFYHIKSEAKLKEVATICMGQNAAKTAREMVVVVVRQDQWRKRKGSVLEAVKATFNGKMGKREKLALTYYEKLIPSIYTNDPFGLFGLVRKTAVHTMGLFKVMYREVGKTDIRVIAHKSAALAAQTLMLSIKAEGYDSCPMEGFDSVRLKKALGLPYGAEVSMVLGIGKRTEKGIYGERYRVDNKDIIFEV